MFQVIFRMQIVYLISKGKQYYAHNENKRFTIDKWGTLYTAALILMFSYIYREQKELKEIE